MPSASIRLRHVRTFVAVAREGSIVRAADVLAVTQPAVSKSIKELETILGTELLDRTRRGGFLLPAGEIFLRHAESSLSALRQGVEQLDKLNAPDALPVRIGALPTVSARLLPEAIQRYRSQGLGATPRIVTGPTAFLMTQLRQGDLDLVIGRMGAAEEMTGLLFEHLYSEPIVFAARAGHPLAGLASPAADLARFECLMPPPGSVIRPTVDRLFLAANLPRPAAVVETVSLAFGRAYIRATDAIWIISEGVVLEDLRAGILTRLAIPTADTQGPVGISTRAGLALPPAAETLLGSLRLVAALIRAG
ncbi:pca operon transcription factor PcaQ [Aureimonas glaciei]|uniref:pca operon transcription factor PcaQ n=1 Tax=Aureimonas glaciei TaxID=1776957 RepID=UPI001663690E|nr:pca operon transcription factor PcaQ [Aureimonas glaciei]